MTTAFETYLSSGARPMGAFFFVRIAGIPKLFCSGRAPYFLRSGLMANGRPYVVFGGEQYEWSETLMVDEGLSVTGGQLQPKGGMPASGGISFHLRVDYREPSYSNNAPDSAWMRLLQRNPSAAGRLQANLDADLDADETAVITFVSNAWSGVSDEVTLYVGKETITCGDSTNTSTQRGSLVRGAYGSTPQTHEATAKTNSETHATGLIVCGDPLVWEGRVVELYMVIGRWRLDALDSGQGDLPEFEPWLEQGSVFSTATQLLDRFVLTNVREGGDNASIILECAGLDALIDGPVIAKAPSATVGFGPGYGWDSRSGQVKGVFLGAHNKRFSMAVRSDGELVAPLIVRVLDNSAVADGDTLTLGSPAGNITITARTTPSTSAEFLIGATADETAQNIGGVFFGYGTLRDHYGWPYRTASYGQFMFKFQSQEGQAADAYTLTSSRPSAIAFSQADTTPLMLAFFNMPLRRWDGSSAYEDVPDGFYDLADISAYMTWTLQEAMANIGLVEWSGAGAFGTHAPQIQLWRLTNEDGSWTNKVNLKLFFHQGGVTEGWAVDVFTRHAGLESFLRDLGFTEDAYFVEPQQLNDSFVGIFTVAANKSPAAFRWPAPGYRRPDRLYIHDFTPWDLAAWKQTTAHFDERGPGYAVAAHAIIGDADLIAFSAGNLASLTADLSNVNGYDLVDGGWYLDVDDSDIRSWGGVEEIYVEVVDPQGDKDLKLPRVERCLYWPTPASLGEGLLQLLIGGSGVEGTLDADYDVGWAGCGMAIPGSFFDVDSFTEYRDNGWERRNWCIRAGDTMRDLLDNECKLAQVQLVMNGGLFVLVSSAPPMASDTPVMALSHENTMTPLSGSGLPFDRAENRIVNVVNIEGDYNPVTKAYQTKYENKRADSISTYGSKEPMSLKIFGSTGQAASQQHAVRLSARIFGAYALPYAVIEQFVCDPAALLLKMGDVVSLDNDVLPSPSSYERGVSGLLAKVFGIDKHYIGTGEGRSGYFVKLVLVCRAYSGGRFARWAPGAYMTSRSGGTGTFRATSFSRDGVLDLSHFTAGQTVEIYNLATGNVETRVISSINLPANTVTFTTTPTASTGMMYWPALASQNATQKTYVTYGNETATLSDGTTTFIYP